MGEKSTTPTFDKLTELQRFAAELCHEANRAYCESIGDHSQVPWPDAPDWQREAVASGVLFGWDGDRTAEESHENWLKDKAEDGWHYGPVKDPVRKTHPAFLPYKELPEAQRVKDHIFHAVLSLTQVMHKRYS